MIDENDLSSPMSHVKATGPSGTGTSTWWAQRVSAIALLPLVIWFAYFVLKAVKLKDISELMSIFISPFPTMLLAVFIVIGLYHGNLGIKEVIEDYVHCHKLKFILVIFINFLSFLTAVAAICALLVFHLSTFSFN
jgi:succinate dehydrogenase / fumarate reductase membrane anchor subunit